MDTAAVRSAVVFPAVAVQAAPGKQKTMKYASQHFNPEQHRQINTAVVAAERNTSAEILPCVATSSGRYDRAEDIVGLWLGVAGMVAVSLLWPPHYAESGRWDVPAAWVFPVALVLAAIVGFIVGAVLASRIAWLRRLFTPSRQMSDEVTQRAGAVFFDQRIHHTAGATGVLLYVSLYERKAVVLADQAILDKLGPNALQDVCDILTSHLCDSHPADALCQAIAAIGEKLAPVLPRSTDDLNELPDALVTLDR
jgi:putative membrane protein